jgi:hypothetical protein
MFVYSIVFTILVHTGLMWAADTNNKKIILTRGPLDQKMTLIHRQITHNAPLVPHRSWCHCCALCYQECSTICLNICCTLCCLLCCPGLIIEPDHTN